MSRTTKFTDSTALYALAGAGDLAAQRLRAAAATTQERVATARNSWQEDRDGMTSRIQHRLEGAFDQFEDTYNGLAGRGRGVVARLRSQQHGAELSEKSTDQTRKGPADPEERNGRA